MSKIGRYLRQTFRQHPKIYSFLKSAGKNKTVVFIRSIWSKIFLRSENNIDYNDLEKTTIKPKTVEGIFYASFYKGNFGDEKKKNNYSNPLVHKNIWVNGPDYNGMEDNDLRGFLDGRFIYAWNQPGQIHVRLGRRSEKPKFGEFELFRVIQRWDNLWLPSRTCIVDASLEVYVEEAINSDLEILLYEVNKDWEPGNGGIKCNNNSVPKFGEVWWNEVGHKVKNWALPGVGFASDVHPDADTPVEPLAFTSYSPNDSSIVFSSDKLIKYIEKRINQKKPLLFLLKLSDYYEDIPGSVINLYSGNHGDNRNTARKPRLILNWNSENEIAHLKKKITLEYGRSVVLSDFKNTSGESIALSFEPKKNLEAFPTFFIKNNESQKVEHWDHFKLPQKKSGNSLEIRINAYSDPIPIGQEFQTELSDTWVRTAPPEEQKVPWVFQSPSGKEHTVFAKYIGEYHWKVRFLPDELGRWQYQWSQKFIDTPYKSAIGIFDVVPGDIENAKKALIHLIEQINESDLPKGEARVREFGTSFFRLQRELIRYNTPESFQLSNSKEDGGDVGKLIDQARMAISGNLPIDSRLRIQENQK